MNIDLLKVVQDPFKEEIEIENLKFSFEFFRFFSNEVNVGKMFQFERLENGVITVKALT